jgi:hypothetical protein
MSRSLWKWQKLTDYMESLEDKRLSRMLLAEKSVIRKVWVHVVDTRIRSLYRCKLIIVRHSLNDPMDFCTLLGFERHGI